MKRLLVSILLSGLGCGNLVWAGDKSGEQDGHARVRFFGQAVIGLTFYENKTCRDGDGVEASKTGFGGLFNNKKNISLGIPETPNVVNLKQRDGILAKAFYREYSVNAGEPLTISASLNETTGRTGYSCGPLDRYFIPEAGRDYEVALDIGSQTCRLSVTQIDSTEAGVKLLPVKLSAAKECSDKDE
jgi:hypothetical protein